MKSLFFIFICFISLHGLGQDAHFSQYNNNDIYLDPSNAGSSLGGRAVAGYRWQWPNLNGDYKTTYFSYDHYLKFLHGGLGAYFLNDNNAGGTFITNNAAFIYSPYFGFHKDTIGKPSLVIKPGFEYAYCTNAVDPDKLTFGDMIDPRRGFIYSTNQQFYQTKRKYSDYSFGLSVFSKRFMAGVAIHHLTQPDVGVLGSSRLPAKYTLHLSGFFGRTDDSTKHFNFIPSFISCQQEDFRNAILSCVVKYDKYSLGIGIRKKDAIIFYSGFSLKHFRVGYSYDLTISALQNTGGSHEINMIYRFAEKKQEEKLLSSKRFSFF